MEGGGISLKPPNGGSYAHIKTHSQGENQFLQEPASQETLIPLSNPTTSSKPHLPVLLCHNQVSTRAWVETNHIHTTAAAVVELSPRPDGHQGQAINLR